MITDLGLLVGSMLALSFIALARNFRAGAWWATAAFAYIATAVYWRAGGAHPETVAGVADFAVCLGIYFFGRYAWEMALWRVFQAMLLVNMIFLAGNLGFIPAVDIFAYSSVLELLNWAALAILGGTSALQWRGGHDGLVYRAWGPLSGAFRALCAQRRHPPFTSRAAR